MSSNPLNLIKRINAIADTGLIYTAGAYDKERYEELKKISLSLMSYMKHSVHILLAKVSPLHMPPGVGSGPVVKVLDLNRFQGACAPLLFIQQIKFLLLIS